MKEEQTMIIETKFDIGDEVFFYEDTRIQSGIIDYIRYEKCPYFTNWMYEFTDGYRMVNPMFFKSKEELISKLNLKV